MVPHLYLDVGEGLLGRSMRTSKLFPSIRLPKRGRRQRKKEKGDKLKPNVKHAHNAKYFDAINTGEKAYWLGFLMADGGVYHKKLWVNLGKKDTAHLYKFKKALDSSHPVKEKEKSSTFFIASVRLIRSLEKYGIVERKTFHTYLPQNIPFNLIRHFIRGYFDGDGSIKYNKKRNTKVFEIKGTKHLLSQIQNILVTELSLPKNKIMAASQNSFVLTYGGNNQVTKIFNYMYTDCVICLERKRDRFVEVQELVAANRGEIGRPKGAKDKQQRKRRRSMEQDTDIKTVSFMAADKPFVPLGSNI